MDCLQFPCIRVEEAVSWTQRFLTRNILAQKSKFIMKNKFKRKRLQKKKKRMIQDDDVLPQTTEPPFLSALHAKNDTTNPFGYKLGESTENNKALLFFSGKETVQTFSGSI